MFPPVTGTRHSFQITPHSTWSAVWVRMRAWRRSQSISPSTSVPTAGARRRRGGATPRSPSLRTSTTATPAERAGVVRLPAAGRVEGGAVEGDGTVGDVRRPWPGTSAGRRRGGTAARSPCRSCHGGVALHSPRWWGAVVGTIIVGASLLLGACTDDSAAPAPTTTIAPTTTTQAPRGNRRRPAGDRRPPPPERQWPRASCWARR